MPFALLRRFCLISTTFLATGTGSFGLAAQPMPDTVPPADRFAPHPYKLALGALWNFRSCGVHVRAADYNGLVAQVREIEAAANARGLGPTLERELRNYRAVLAVSLLTACGGGPVRARVEAVRAITAFREWVNSRPTV